MQLDAQLVRSGLCHGDENVRRICTDWINDMGPRQAARVDDIIAAFGRFSLWGVLDIQVRECDSRLLDWILEHAETNFDETPLNAFRSHNVWEWIERANTDLIRSRWTDIQSALAGWNTRHTGRYQELSLLPRLQARLNMLDLGPEECWRRLIEKCRLMDSTGGEARGYKWYSPELEGYLECAATGDIASRVIRTLAEDEQTKAKYEIAAMLLLARRMHLEEAAPYALSLIKFDWDFLRENINSYFKENCSERLQQLVSEGFVERPWDEQIYLYSVFTADYSQASATYLRQFLAYELAGIDLEDDEEISGANVTMWAQALASQFCTEDIDILDNLYQSNPLHPEFVQVAEYLHALNVLGQLNDPRDYMWRDAEASAYIESDVDEQPEREPYPENFDDVQFIEASETIRNEPRQHVGRNDPCPCGSGKKYKKCCLGKRLPSAE